MKYCVLDKSKICNDCGECLRCDLDPSKQCDNCGKCIQESDPNSEYRSVNYRLSDGELESDGFDDFLDEPIEIGMPAPIEIDPSLIAEWEKRLAESFKSDNEDIGDIAKNMSRFRAVRRRHRRKDQTDCTKSI